MKGCSDRVMQALWGSQGGPIKVAVYVALVDLLCLLNLGLNTPLFRQPTSADTLAIVFLAIFVSSSILLLAKVLRPKLWTIPGLWAVIFAAALVSHQELNIYLVGVIKKDVAHLEKTELFSLLTRINPLTSGLAYLASGPFLLHDTFQLLISKFVVVFLCSLRGINADNSMFESVALLVLLTLIESSKQARPEEQRSTQEPNSLADDRLAISSERVREVSREHKPMPLMNCHTVSQSQNLEFLPVVTKDTQLQTTELLNPSFQMKISHRLENKRGDSPLEIESVRLGGTVMKNTSVELRDPNNQEIDPQFSFTTKPKWLLQPNVQNVNNFNINISSGVKVLQIGTGDNELEPHRLASHLKQEVQATKSQQSLTKETKGEGSVSKPGNGQSPPSHIKQVLSEHVECMLRLQPEDKGESKIPCFKLVGNPAMPSVEDPFKQELYSRLQVQLENGIAIDIQQSSKPKTATPKIRFQTMIGKPKSPLEPKKGNQTQKNLSDRDSLFKVLHYNKDTNKVTLASLHQTLNELVRDYHEEVRRSPQTPFKDLLEAYLGMVVKKQSTNSINGSKRSINAGKSATSFKRSHFDADGEQQERSNQRLGGHLYPGRPLHQTSSLVPGKLSAERISQETVFEVVAVLEIAGALTTGVRTEDTNNSISMARGSTNRREEYNSTQIGVESSKWILDVAMEVYRSDNQLQEASSNTDGDLVPSNGENTRKTSFASLSKSYCSSETPPVIQLNFKYARLQIVSPKAKSQNFLNLISHEMRSPLIAIEGLIRMFINKAPQELKGVSSSKFRHVTDTYLTPACFYIRNLLDACQLILDLSKSDSSAGALKTAEFSLLNLIREICGFFERQIEDQHKEFKIRYEWDEHIDTFIKSDPVRIRQILINLISNSVKYTTKGEIVVSAVAETFHKIKISVRDTGLGIKKSDLGKLFREFGRIQNEGDEVLNEHGVGLGLVLSNRLVRTISPPGINRGIDVVSEYGKGSEFSFYLENKFKNHEEVNMLRSKTVINENLTSCLGQNLGIPRQISNPNNNVISETRSSVRLTDPDQQFNSYNGRYNILIVDDSEFNLSYIKMLFENVGFAPIISNSPIQALTIIHEKLEQKHCQSCAVFDLILTDLEMPFMDGVEFAQSVRELEEYFQVPIICSSANEIEPERAEVFTFFIKKPITNQDVVELIDSYLPKTNAHTCDVGNLQTDKKVENCVAGNTVIAANNMRELDDFKDSSPQDSKKITHRVSQDSSYDVKSKLHQGSTSIIRIPSLNPKLLRRGSPG